MPESGNIEFTRDRIIQTGEGLTRDAINQVGSVSGRVKEGAITARELGADLDQRFTDLEGADQGLADRVTTAEADIDAAEGRLDTLEPIVQDEVDRNDTQDTAITALQTGKADINLDNVNDRAVVFRHLDETLRAQLRDESLIVEGFWDPESAAWPIDTTDPELPIGPSNAPTLTVSPLELAVGHVNPVLTLNLANDTFGPAVDSQNASNWVVVADPDWVGTVTIVRNTDTQVTMTITGTVTASQLFVMARAAALIGSLDSSSVTIDASLPQPTLSVSPSVAAFDTTAAFTVTLSDDTFLSEVAAENVANWSITHPNVADPIISYTNATTAVITFGSVEVGGAVTLQALAAALTGPVSTAVANASIEDNPNPPA